MELHWDNLAPHYENIGGLHIGILIENVPIPPLACQGPQKMPILCMEERCLVQKCIVWLCFINFWCVSLCVTWKSWVRGVRGSAVGGQRVMVVGHPRLISLVQTQPARTHQTAPVHACFFHLFSVRETEYFFGKIFLGGIFSGRVFLGKLFSEEYLIAACFLAEYFWYKYFLTEYCFLFFWKRGLFWSLLSRFYTTNQA